jgi:hypothetical protein
MRLRRHLSPQIYRLRKEDLLSDLSVGALTYRLPQETLAGHSNAVLLGRLRRFEEWSAALGVATQGTRIDRYARYLEWVPRSKGELDSGIFIDPPENPIRHGLDRLLYVLREVHELTWISEGLRDRSIPDLERKLTKVVKGTDFAALDRNTESRNTQFELRIASHFARAGYHITLDNLTDIVATRRRTTYHLECKRVASEKQLGRRIKEATDQLRGRIPRSTLWRGHHGLVAVDVTKVAFTHNGLIWGQTPDHTRDLLQEKLKAIAHALEMQSSVFEEPAIALWMQIHIACLVVQPPQPITRFSSCYVPNFTLGFRSLMAARRIWTQIRSINTNDPGDEKPRSLEPRRRLSIPPGTVFRFGENFLSSIMSNGGKLPDLPDEQVVLSVKQPNSDAEAWEDFSFYEMKLLFAQLSEHERKTLATSPEHAHSVLLPRLLCARYPYVGQAPWLDGPIGTVTSSSKLPFI